MPEQTYSTGSYVPANTQQGERLNRLVDEHILSTTPLMRDAYTNLATPGEIDNSKAFYGSVFGNYEPGGGDDIWQITQNYAYNPTGYEALKKDYESRAGSKFDRQATLNKLESGRTSGGEKDLNRLLVQGYKDVPGSQGSGSWQDSYLSLPSSRQIDFRAGGEITNIGVPQASGGTQQTAQPYEQAASGYTSADEYRKYLEGLYGRTFTPIGQVSDPNNPWAV